MSPVDHTGHPPAPALPRRWLEAARGAAMPLALLALIVFFSLAAPRFLSVANLLTIVTDASVVGILAIGMTFVLILAGVDLSVGAIVTFTTVVLGLTLREWELPLALSLGLALLTGVAVGLVNGLVIVAVRVPPIIVTLGMLSIVNSLALAVTEGATTSLRRVAVLNFIGQGRLTVPGTGVAVPFPALVLVVLALACHLLLARSTLGVRLRAIGGNPAASRLMGLNVRAHTVGVYVLSGLLASLGGLIVAGRLASASATAGAGLELSAIAAAVLGGTSLSGGSGSILGTLAGALMLSVLLNGLILLSVPFFYQLVATGLVLVAAVAFNEAVRRRG